MEDNKYNNDHEESELSFPLRTIPESEKTEKYHRSWAKAMYSAYLHDKGAIPFSFKKTIHMLRMYGRGQQPIEMYIKRQFNTGTTASASIDTGTENSYKWDREGMGNIDTNIISVAPRVKSMIKAYLKNIREDVVIDTIDPNSGAMQEQKKWETMIYAKNKDFVRRYQQAAGLDVDEPEFLPDTIGELEMYADAGGFKMAEASFMERLVQYTMELSGYDDELENEVQDDLMDLGIACTKTRLDPDDLKFKDHYIDVGELVVQHSRHNDFHDIDWIGHVEPYTISTIRKVLPDVDESVFRGMAQAYEGRAGNPSNFNKYDKVTDFGGRGYDEFTVLVFEAEWRDEEVEEAVFYDNKNGKTSKLPVTEETTKDLGPRKRLRRSNLEKRRQCAWVIGTEHIFEWGEVNMMDRPTQSKTASNYHIRALSDASLISQLIPVLDELQISYLRWQDARANAVKKGYAINLAKLQAISDGEKNYKIADIIKLWKERGLLLYKESISGRYEGGRTLPIDEIPSNLLDQLTEFVQSWDHALKRMEDLTGINPLILGATPDPNAPVGTQKMSVASSASAIRPLGLAMNAIKRESAQSFMRRFTLAAKARKDIMNSYSGVIGERAIEQLINAGRSMVDYGMFFNPRPTDAEKQELKDAALQSMQNRREGRPGIDLTTYEQIVADLYANVNLKLLRTRLAYNEKEIYRRDQEEKMRMINAQADRNDRSAQIAAQGEMQKKQMELQGESALKQQISEADIIKSLIDRDDEVAQTIARRMGVKSSNNMPQVGAEPSSPPQ